MTEVTSTNAIRTIESCRRDSSGTVACKLGLFLHTGSHGSGSLLSEVINPQWDSVWTQNANCWTFHLEQLYNFISYIFKRSYTLKPPHPPYYAKTFFPALAIGYVILAMCSYWLTLTLNTLQSWNLSGKFCQSGSYSSTRFSPSHYA